MQGRQNAKKCHWCPVTSAGLEVLRGGHTGPGVCRAERVGFPKGGGREGHVRP